MAEISAKDVMKLRNQTGLPMMDCKDALEKNNGDFEMAQEYLRKKLKGKMEGRTERAAGEGRVGIAIAPDNSAAAIVEIRAETDFTAKNEKFQAAVATIANQGLAMPAGDFQATADMLKPVDDLRISTGENCRFSRGKVLKGAAGATRFGSYVHHDGKTGVLVQAEGDVSDELLKQIGMHIAAANPRPLGVTAEDIPADLVEKERKFRIEQAMESGKPQQIAEKMVEGAIKKFYSDMALVEQPFVMDPTKPIKEVVGGKGRLVAFVRWQLGETDA
ncbi:MAG: translation elongation factor Ts [Phycisphaeraceae bacterium]|nr:translation elongation factor Ts [Phycisphaeraceae bacterium]MCW5753880.1 translation elongation factor Ts [Phycisphaeraceae bacterium]